MENRIRPPLDRPKYIRGRQPKKNKNPLILEGIPAIAAFLGKSYNTAKRYIVQDGLPAAKLPNGTWITHKALILQWILVGHQAEMKARSCLDPKVIREMAEQANVPLEDILNA
jgi:hypothetical protein